MRVYIISIRPERLRSCLERLSLPAGDVTVIGVNGRTLCKTDMIQDGSYVKLHKWHDLTRGELGCFLSHRAVWRHMQDHDVPEALILEDDCQMQNTDYQRALGLVDTLSKSDPLWNVLQLVRMINVRSDVRRVSQSFVIPGRSWGLACYALSKRGAGKLLTKSVPIKEAVDTFVSNSRLHGKYALYTDLCLVTATFSDTVDIK
jgi:glycosyl transferase family 25